MSRIFTWILSINASTVWTAVGAIGTILAAFIAVFVYKDTVQRAMRLATIEEYTRIRNAYPNLSPKASNLVDDETRLNYLKEMERFCTGVNLKLYHIETLNKMSGARLITQYDEYIKQLILDRRDRVRNVNADDLYCEYEKTIEELKKAR